MSHALASPRSVGLVLKAAAILLAIGLVAEQSDRLALIDWVEGDAGANVMRILAFWLHLLAPGFYLVALWSLGGFFARIAASEAFGPAMTRSLRGAGLNLILGAGAAILLAPSLTPVLTGEGGMQVGVHLAVEPVAIGLIGVALRLIASAGGRLRGELEQFV